MSWTALREQLAMPLALAALLGGGSTIIANKVELGRVDVRVTRLEELNGKIDQLSADLSKTREDLLRANPRAIPAPG